METKKIRTSIIPIFIPHIGCPYRCVFCNQWRITGQHFVPDAAYVARQIRAYTTGASEGRHLEVAFYGGSFTAIPSALQEALLAPARAALEAKVITAIRCSTRPDCIDAAVLSRLRTYGLTIVELGVQSMDDRVLALTKRGHTAADVCRATALLKNGGFTVGHQLMPGLPGEDWQSLLQTTAAICRLAPDIARIYPVAVIESTELAEQWRRGDYKALTIHEGVRRSAYMKQHFLEAGIKVIRTGLQATTDLDDPSQVLAGAYTPAMGELVDTHRYQRQLFAELDRMKETEDITISYARCDTSRVRGFHNVNVKRARLRYGRPFIWREVDWLSPQHVAITSSDETKILAMDQETVEAK